MFPFARQIFLNALYHLTAGIRALTVWHVDDNIAAHRAVPKAASSPLILPIGAHLKAGLISINDLIWRDCRMGSLFTIAF